MVPSLDAAVLSVPLQELGLQLRGFHLLRLLVCQLRDVLVRMYELPVNAVKVVLELFISRSLSSSLVFWVVAFVSLLLPAFLLFSARSAASTSLACKAVISRPSCLMVARNTFALPAIRSFSVMVTGSSRCRLAAGTGVRRESLGPCLFSSFTAAGGGGASFEAS